MRWFIVAWLSGTLGANALAQCPTSFADAVSYAVGNGPYEVIATDLDNDGHADLAVANFSSNNISVIIGNEDGSFGAATQYAVGSGAIGIAAADLNHDGRVDLAVANYGSSTISLLLNSGGGTFQSPLSINVGGLPWALAISELNKDTHADLVVSNSASDRISILLGNGDGSFQPPSSISVGLNPAGLVLDDFNNDSAVDVAVVNFNGDSLSVLLANGNGTFQPPSELAVGIYPLSVTAGDFNADGFVDLATANNGSGSASALYGNGDGTFGPATSVPVGGAPRWVIFDTIDADNIGDLVVNGGGGLSVLIGRGDGTFGAPLTFSSGSTPWAVVAGYFDADESIDLALTDYDSDLVSVWLNTTASQWPPQIDQQPVSQGTLAGSTVTLSLAATGEKLAYQWRREGVDLANSSRIVGADTDALSIIGVQPSDQGRYDCIVSNPCTAITSSIAELSCRPIITEEPPTTAILRAGLQLSVSVPTGAPYTYRWRQNGQNLFNIAGLFSGVTTRTLTLLAVDPSLAGTYDCVLNDSCGSTQSDPTTVYCPADFDQDWFVSGQDFDAFVMAFEVGDSRADFDGDEFITGVDFDLYVQAFEMGC